MGVNEYLGRIVSKRDENLMDAIIEGDEKTIIFLANTVHKAVILKKRCILEPMNLAKISQALESRLNTTGIVLK